MYSDGDELEQKSNELGEFYGGVEPVDVGNLDDVKEQRTVLPPTKRVRIKITKAEITTNNENTYRWIGLTVRLVNGIDELGKFKDKPMFANVCYYADPSKYTADFFATKQHLVGLKYLMKATGLELKRIDGHVPGLLVEAPEIYCDIIQKKDKQSGELVNELKNYQAIPIEELA